MFSIQTKNLTILALDLESLKLLKKDRILLEEHLNLQFTDHNISKDIQAELRKELTYRIEEVEDYPEQYEWFTSWEIILKKQNQSVGAIALSGYPDEHGLTSVGYYIDSRHRNKGYASEALQALTIWAFSNIKLKQINASTPTNNIKSQRVLEKCGFKKVETKENTIYWELKR